MLKKNNLPITSAQPFKSKETLDLLAYLDIVASDSKDDAFLRIYNVPKRSIGKATVTSLRTLATKQNISLLRAARLATGATKAITLPAKQRQALADFLKIIETLRSACASLPLPEALCAVAQISGYEEAAAVDSETQTKVKKGLAALVQQAGFFQSHTNKQEAKFVGCELLSRFVASVRVGERNADEAPDFVTLSTIHQAKGLEWRAVFVLNFNDGLLPLPFRAEESDPATMNSRPAQQTNASTTAASSACAANILNPLGQVGSAGVGSIPGSSIVTGVSITDSSRTVATDPAEIGPGDASAHLEEERRLAYVAMSRARDMLFLRYVSAID